MKATTGKAFVEVVGLTKQFGEVKAIDDISLSIGEQELVGLLGPNGAGKSTLAKILVTLLKPTSGEVCIDGYHLSEHPKKIREIIGYVPAQPILYPHLTAWENLVLFSNFYGIKKHDAQQAIEELLEAFDLWEWRYKILRKFSTGMVQKVNICRGLIHDPKLLVLDEPFNGLDPVSRSIVKTYLDRMVQKGKTILLTTHFLDSVDDFINKVIILNRGKVFSHEDTHTLKEAFLKNQKTLQIEVKGTLSDSVPTIGAFPESIRLKEIKGANFFVFEIDSLENLEDKIRVIQSKFSKVSYFHTKDPTLEEIFISLTKKTKPSEVRV